MKLTMDYPRWKIFLSVFRSFKTKRFAEVFGIKEKSLKIGKDF